MQSVNRTRVVTISHLQYSNSFQISQRSLTMSICRLKEMKAWIRWRKTTSFKIPKILHEVIYPLVIFFLFSPWIKTNGNTSSLTLSWCGGNWAHIEHLQIASLKAVLHQEDFIRTAKECWVLIRDVHSRNHGLLSCLSASPSCSHPSYMEHCPSGLCNVLMGTHTPLWPCHKCQFCGHRHGCDTDHSIAILHTWSHTK